MSENLPQISPWLTIVGVNENGLDGLSNFARQALEQADVIFGAPRHLQLADAQARGIAWPKPFSIAPILAAREQSPRPKIVALASGDPFWHGVGAVLAERLEPEEWRCFSAPSTFALAAARLGWRLEDTVCLGLHAKPFSRALRHLHNDVKLIVLLADGGAPEKFAQWMTSVGFGASKLYVLERLGGPCEKIRVAHAQNFDLLDINAPVAVAVVCSGQGFSRTPGLPDHCFAHDGQIAKAPARALTVCALEPRPKEILWDIGAGSGSIAIEWALAGGRAFAIEARQDRFANILANVENFGLCDRIHSTCGFAPQNMEQWPAPHAAFIGGGASRALIEMVWARMVPGARLVVNAVTLETEALIYDSAQNYGGSLMRFDIATAAPLGRYRSFAPARPLTQWRAVKGAPA